MSKIAKQILIARHGNRLDFVHPEWFTIARRRYDPPLSQDGKEQILQLAKTMTTEKIDHIFASPFLRTIQTAHIIAQNLNLPIKLEAGLGEWHNADWMSESPQIHSQQELEVGYPSIDWSYTSQVIPHYPETEAEVLERINMTIDKLIFHSDGNLLIVGHSITVTGIIKALINSDNHEQEFKTDLGSLNKIIQMESGAWSLDCD